MAKKVVLKDILSKLSNIFKNDIYIYKKRYVVGGDISESRNVTKFMCVINIDLVELLACIPDDVDLVYLSDIKKQKDTFETSITPDIEESKKLNVINFIRGTEEKANRIDSWSNFNFTDEDKALLYDENITLELFKDDENIPSVTVSKTLFPLVTEKTIDNLYYHVILPKKEKDLVELFTSFDFDYFQIYNIIVYLDLSTVEIEE
jgi:hypothetical protein